MSFSGTISLKINGVPRDVTIDDPRITLLDLLRDRLDLTGTKMACDRGQCGACTVLIDGHRMYSCLKLALAVDGASILTIEGVATPDQLHPLQAAFAEYDAFQCGFCTAGQIMSALGFLREGECVPDHEHVSEGMSGNLCRCGTYEMIRTAILAFREKAGESRTGLFDEYF